MKLEEFWALENGSEPTAKPTAQVSPACTAATDGSASAATAAAATTTKDQCAMLRSTGARERAQRNKGQRTTTHVGQTSTRETQTTTPQKTAQLCRVPRRPLANRSKKMRAGDHVRVPSCARHCWRGSHGAVARWSQRRPRRQPRGRRRRRRCSGHFRQRCARSWRRTKWMRTSTWRRCSRPFPGGWRPAPSAPPRRAHGPCIQIRARRSGRASHCGRAGAPAVSGRGRCAGRAAARLLRAARREHRQLRCVPVR